MKYSDAQLAVRQKSCSPHPPPFPANLLYLAQGSFDPDYTTFNMKHVVNYTCLLTVQPSA